MPTLECRVTLLVGLFGQDQVRGPWALPPEDEVWVGRGAESGLWIPEEWVPRALCRFMPGPVGKGWVLQNGSQAWMRVQNQYVEKHDFAPRSMVVLQEGETHLSWPDLDDKCQLGVLIGEGVASELDVLENGRLVRDVPRTDYAAQDVDLTAKQRATLAVLFAHLLLGTKKPQNLAKTAGRHLGRGEAAITMLATEVRKNINAWRWQKLQTTEQLGHYLVVTTRTLNPADLPDSYLHGPGRRP